ncbi:MAG: thioredoxin domain-containing protein [Clostridiaceae bacterium]|nr:thioredoxin domain-containing protein [Clostridiaceae bacterium]
MSNSERVPNRLINEKSPYLLQHAYNPVDWFPWGEEAFARAKSEDKPVFLSIGYSTCHWCHVMERESFEDKEVAEFLNRHFIAIKVDREERPDIDHVYMSVCQAMTGHGGWPLTIIMTPDKKPFFAGTYFPKNDRYGIPGLMSILRSITKAWKEKRDNLENAGNRIIEAVYNDNHYDPKTLSRTIIDETYRQLERSFDPEYGGFGNAPKFPVPHNLLFLLRYWFATGEMKALEMVEKTLDSMYKGGIYDHIGFGFCRYSTDRKWLVPHFEKMLYDNALLSIAFAEAYQATKNKKYAQAAYEIYEYIKRDMTSPEGAFYSAEDADSEGVEGLFYTWLPEEITSVLGEEDGKRFCDMFDITSSGNFEGRNIPNLIRAEEIDYNFIEKCRSKLLSVREKRVHPFKDDKILTSWNALMAASCAIGGRILNDKSLVNMAEKAVSFINTRLKREDGRLYARFRDGEADIPAFLDDYAFLQWAYIELYESTFEPEFLKDAVSIYNEIERLFSDTENGGFFFYGNDAEKLISRPKDAYDGAVPSGNSVMAMNLLRLFRMTGNIMYVENYEKQLKAFSGQVSLSPSAYVHMLTSYLVYMQPPQEIIVVSNEPENTLMQYVDIVRNNFRPFTSLLIYGSKYKELEDVIPYISGYTAPDGKTHAYVCKNFACEMPVSDLDDLRRLLS